jgi:transcriptional regulator with XRE-family HTH domain
MGKARSQFDGRGERGLAVDDTSARLGRRLREIRMGRGLSLQDAARRAGLSKSFLSEVEQGRVSPSVASLTKIAAALGIPIGSLFEDQRSVGRLVRASERARLHYPVRGVTDYLLSPDLSGKLQVLYSVGAPGTSSGPKLYTHEADEECVVLLKGSLEIRVGDETYVLEPGDAITFPSRTPHGWRNIGCEPTESIWIITPPAY